MKFENAPPTESERKRRAWFKERARPGTTLTEAIRLSEEALGMFPVTEEERRLDLENKMGIPEFEF